MQSVSGQARIQTQPVLLKTQASQFSSFYLRSHSQRPSIFVQLYCGVLVCEKRAGDGVLEPCSASSPWGSLTHFICCPSVYRQLYWFSLGKSLPWLPSSPLLLIQSQNVQIHTCVPTPAPGAEDRVESTSQDRGFCWAMCRWLPAVCPWELGAFYLLSSCSSHRPYFKCFAIS